MSLRCSHCGLPIRRGVYNPDAWVTDDESRSLVCHARGNWGRGDDMLPHEPEETEEPEGFTITVTADQAARIHGAVCGVRDTLADFHMTADSMALDGLAYEIQQQLAAQGLTVPTEARG